MNNKIMVYMKDGEVSLWTKAHIWHKYMHETPALYVKAMKKIGMDYGGPSFWGTQEEAPEDTGYRFLGELK